MEDVPLSRFKLFLVILCFLSVLTSVGEVEDFFALKELRSVKSISLTAMKKAVPDDKRQQADYTSNKKQIIDGQSEKEPGDNSRSFLTPRFYQASYISCSGYFESG